MVFKEEGTWLRPGNGAAMERAEAEAILDGDRETAITLLLRVGELIEANRRLEARGCELEQRLHRNPRTSPLPPPHPPPPPPPPPAPRGPWPPARSEPASPAATRSSSCASCSAPMSRRARSRRSCAAPGKHPQDPTPP